MGFFGEITGVIHAKSQKTEGRQLATYTLDVPPAWYEIECGLVPLLGQEDRVDRQVWVMAGSLVRILDRIIFPGMRGDSGRKPGYMSMPSPHPQIVSKKLIFVDTSHGSASSFNSAVCR